MTDITFETTAQDVASRSLRVTVPLEKLAEAERRAVKEYARQVRLPGFRKGHAPEPVVRRRFGSEIKQYVLQDAVRESWDTILKTGDLQPTADPQISNLSFEEGQPLAFDVLVEVRPSLELATTGGFELTRSVEAVADEQVAEQVAKLREQKATWVPLEGAGVRPKPGQLVSVTVTSLENGEPTAEASPHSLVLGDGQAIPDLEERIMAMAPGETVDAEVRLPEDHPDEARRGEARQVRVTLHDVKEQALPELDDAFAAEFGEFASMEALQAAIRTDLEAEARRSADSAVRDQLIEQLVAANDVPTPPSLVARLIGAYAEGYQVPPEQREAFAGQFRPIAEAQVRRELVLDAVATAHNLQATEEDLDARIAEMATARGMETGKLYAQLEQAKRLPELERQVTEEKTFTWLLEQSTVSEGAA
jgi:trigger factor